MKKRQKIAIIAVIVILIIVAGLLVMNYIKYSYCRGADAAEKPGCISYPAEEGKNATKPLFPIRLNFGSRYIEIG